MRLILLSLLGALIISVTGCSKFESYNGPEVTRIVVIKSTRQMYLMHNEEILEAYEFELGFAPEGDKEIEGDGRTPEGRYFIDRRNPNSEYYLSIGISYPNDDDREAARELGFSPGGDIFIHGTPRAFRNRDDWTAGCIAVSNREMRQIYAMVREGTVIDIFP
ncbi:L,D-transpeptidase family protein [Rhodobacterales bacterium HKCCE3408]|nr:L,D-transpeptidase family protein [Rhodobacterales bacterium HKCCE3408]